jgi:phosphatidylglycerophosphatase A
MALLFASVCLRFGAYAELHWRTKDPSQVVADEWAGQSIALLFLPWRPMVDRGSIVADLSMAALAFLSFRLLDIIKPPPARRLQRLPGGLGILIDDLFAGLYALALTQLVLRLVV